MPRVRCAFGHVGKLIVRQTVFVSQLIIKPPMLVLPNADFVNKTLQKLLVLHRNQ